MRARIPKLPETKERGNTKQGTRAPSLVIAWSTQSSTHSGLKNRPQVCNMPGLTFAELFHVNKKTRVFA